MPATDPSIASPRPKTARPRPGGLAPRLATSLFAGCLAACLACALTACTPYVSYPAEQGGRYAKGDINAQPGPIVMRQSLSRVITTDRAAGINDDTRWGVNLPQGMRQRTAELMLEGIERVVGGDGVLVGEPGYENAAMYSVTRLWIRGDEARVDVVRPVNGGEYQRVTVRLRGPLGQWRIESVLDWPEGLAEEPELYGWPEPYTPARAADEAEEAGSQPISRQPDNANDAGAGSGAEN